MLQEILCLLVFQDMVSRMCAACRQLQVNSAQYQYNTHIFQQRNQASYTHNCIQGLKDFYWKDIQIITSTK